MQSSNQACCCQKWSLNWSMVATTNLDANNLPCIDIQNNAIFHIFCVNTCSQMTKQCQKISNACICWFIIPVFAMNGDMNQMQDGIISHSYLCVFIKIVSGPNHAISDRLILPKKVSNSFYNFWNPNTPSVKCPHLSSNRSPCKFCQSLKKWY